MEYNKYLSYCMKMVELGKMNQPFINKQLELCDECKKKRLAFDSLDDKLHSLYKKAIEEIGFSEDDYKFENNTGFINLLNITIKHIEGDEKLMSDIKKFNESTYYNEIKTLETQRSIAFFEYAKCHLLLDKAINDSKEKLFTIEYKLKMDEYAKDGIMLFFLETPDYPILDDEFTENDFLDFLCNDDFEALRVLYSSFINCQNPGTSMRRKIDDIIDVFNNLSGGGYRSSARTIFALIESEEKNVSKAFQTFFEKKKEYETGLDRFKKIDELSLYINMPYAKQRWIKMNDFHKKMVTSEKDCTIDRNAIVHGDYNNDVIDINKYDVVKLLLLYLSIRTYGDYIQNHANLYSSMFEYLCVFIGNEKRK